MELAGLGAWMVTAGVTTATGLGCVVSAASSSPDPGCRTSQATSKDGDVTNGCDGALPAPQPWPGGTDVTTADRRGAFGGSLSGLTYEPKAGTRAAILWAVVNTPATLYRLVLDGSSWAPDEEGGWSGGKALVYPRGTGEPDAESVTKAEWGTLFVYVAAERDLNRPLAARRSVLRFDTSQPGSELTATHEWNLTSDLPAAADANLGIEGLTWIPDQWLVAASLVDESTGQTYEPSRYPDHGEGLFVVGMEDTGVLYAYALDHASGGVHRVATIASGNGSNMALEFDRDLGYLWAQCDDTCDGQVAVLDIDAERSSPTFGRFGVRARFRRPRGMPNVNNEGNAFAPESECDTGSRRYFWADDSETDGHAIRVGTIPCGQLF